MPYETGTASDYRDLLDKLRRFICGYGVAGTPAFAGSGPGTISFDTLPASVTETWTITCTDDSTPGAEVWSVTGSVSGAQAAATTGVAYDNSIITFTISGSGYAVADEFEAAVTQGALSADSQAWEELRWQAAGGEDELLVKGTGLAGTDEIYAGIRTYSSVAGNYYNWEIVGMLGHESGFTFQNQPGIFASLYPKMYLFNSTITYWFIANGRRFIVVAKVSTVYEACYNGLITPYSPESVLPLPHFVAGSGTTVAARYSATDANHTHGLIVPSGDGTRLYTGEQWRSLNASSNGLWPYAEAVTYFSGPKTITDLLRPNVDASHTLFPIIPFFTSPITQVFGELDGCFWTSYFSNAAENLIDVGGVDHLVVQNCFRTGANNYWAAKLE